MSLSEAFPLRDSRGDLWRMAKANRRRPSEGQLADLFVERHCREVRFLTGAPADRAHRQPARKAQWAVWSDADGEWLPDALNLAQRLAREICREAAETCDDPAVDSNRVVRGVLSLAKCDPRLVASDWPCDPHIEAAVAEWVSDHVILDPNAWTPRADLLASFVGWEQFDADDLTAALEAHGITYRRKANSHGFDGMRIKDDSDVDA
jgi:hypothetical protein